MKEYTTHSWFSIWTLHTHTFSVPLPCTVPLALDPSANSVQWLFTSIVCLKLVNFDFSVKIWAVAPQSTNKLSWQILWHSDALNAKESADGSATTDLAVSFFFLHCFVSWVEIFSCVFLGTDLAVFEYTHRLNDRLTKWKFSQKNNLYFVLIVDVSASTEAFVETVCLIAVRRSFSGRTGCRRCGKVGRTPRLCSSTCLAPSWCVWPVSYTHLTLPTKRIV